ncbi:hypothetical protein HZC53_00650 [Candidatus Uhrbacteria bacterium]|nr:hypothetical protein [Candidatus Uhrbacteria bacterium]
MFPLQLKRTTDQPAPTGQITYIAAKNGIFMHKRTAVFAATVRAKELPMLLTVPSGLEFNLPPLPAVHAAYLLDFFQQARNLTECTPVVMLWHKAGKGYQIQIPIQTSGYNRTTLAYEPNFKAFEEQDVSFVGIATAIPYYRNATSAVDELVAKLPKPLLILAYRLDSPNKLNLEALVQVESQGLLHIRAQKVVSGLVEVKEGAGGPGTFVSVNHARTHDRIVLPKEHADAVIKAPHKWLERVRVNRWDSRVGRMADVPITEIPSLYSYSGPPKFVARYCTKPHK